MSNLIGCDYKDCDDYACVPSRFDACYPDGWVTWTLGIGNSARETVVHLCPTHAPLVTKDSWR